MKNLIKLNILLFSLLSIPVCAPAMDWNEIEKGVVCIVTANPLDVEKTAGTGTGFVINKEGYIITNAHVVNVEGEELIRRLGGNPVLKVVMGKNDILDARVVKVYPEKDLAVVRIDRAGLHPLLLAGEIEKGENVIALGFPGDAVINQDAFFQCKRSGGMVSAFVTMDDGLKTIQTDAAIHPGNSGGPLCNEEGKVIGVNFIKSTKAEGIAWAIHIDEVRKVLKELNIRTEEDSASGLMLLLTALMLFSVLTILLVFLIRKKNIPVGPDLSENIGIQRKDIETKEFRARIICLKGEYKGSEINISEKGLILGRDPAQANLVFKSKDISRRHAKITFRPDSKDFLLEDPGSRNGIYLKGKNEKIRSTVIKSGDEFFLGKSGSDETRFRVLI